MSFAYVNNKIVPKNEAEIELEDRGYQFGDGVYEVIGVFNFSPFKVQEHLERLFESAKKVKLNIGYSIEQLTNMILELKEKNNLEKGLIYIQATRGVAVRNHSFPKEEVPSTLIAYTITSDRPSSAIYKAGVSTIITEDIRWLRCDIKTLNLLPNVLAKQEAVENNAFESILYRDDETITEGSSTNVFVVKNDVIYTHPANNLILNGITRQTIIEICKDLNLEIKEITFSKSFLLNADEVFISGTYVDILPVKSILNESVEFPTERNITFRLMNELGKITLNI